MRSLKEHAACQWSTENDRVGEIMDRRFAATREGETERQDKARSARPRAKVRSRSMRMGR